MIDTARVLLTLACKRHCTDCANTPQMLAAAKLLVSVQELAGFKVVCITGGEPMLQPDLVLAFIKALREVNTEALIYVYLSDWHNLHDVRLVLAQVNGMHYTIHDKAGNMDMIKFILFQNVIAHYPYHSFRLYVHPEANIVLSINVPVWQRVEVKPWIHNCPLPTNEQLFITEEAL